ncbi:putative membrane protein YqiK [Amaricoccus macauensis]|uniref:Putative membrane protein YqiK n=1 Tax=Amaricoccus macauensis TaxID=57001 RepID=A0A840SQ34_9RHOB|nr:hypothetical protein [Amaricoccus macauensis]MBB5223184.1 putative membrane protein YqiK [Amaricoccus macauensis]
MERLIGLGFPVAVILAGLVAVSLILARLYRRATKEIALVKTGLGGRKVVMDGGIVVLPLFHEIARVNMNTLHLPVSRTGARP